MAYTYEQVFAADPSNPSNVAQNASITIFAPGDGTMTPLTITDPDGQPLSNPLPVNANGFGSAFAHATLDRVAWAGGGFTGFFTSYEGMKQVAVDAQAAAEAAAATAGAEAAAIADAALSSAVSEAASAATDAAASLANAEAAAVAAANAAALVGAPADEAIAAAVTGAGATKAALDANYATEAAVAGKIDQTVATATLAPILGARPATRAVFLGDSIVKGSDDPPTVTRSTSWPVYASIHSGQRLRYMHNAGVAGENTTAMLARFDTSVTAKNPNMVIVGGPTNDFTSGGIGMTGSKANIQTIVGKIREIGAVPVLCTITPAAGATPTARRSDVIRMNAWLRDYAAKQGIVLLDFYGQMVDAATGQFLSAYSSGDFIHPNAAGYAALGKYVADTLAPVLPQWAPALPQENGDPNNLLTNGLFLTDADTNNIPDGWTNQSGITGQTLSLVTDAAIKGKWFRYDVTASSGDSQLYQSKSTGIVPGNTYAFMGRIKTSGFTTGSVYARIRWTATANRDDTPMNLLQAQIDNGVFYCEVVAPAGATSVQANLQVKAGTGWAQYAQVALYDLTAMGVV